MCAWHGRRLSSWNESAGRVSPRANIGGRDCAADKNADSDVRAEISASRAEYRQLYLSDGLRPAVAKIARVLTAGRSAGRRPKRRRRRPIPRCAPELTDAINPSRGVERAR